MAESETGQDRDAAGRVREIVSLLAAGLGVVGIGTCLVHYGVWMGTLLVSCLALGLGVAGMWRRIPVDQDSVEHVIEIRHTENLPVGSNDVLEKDER